MPLDFLHHFNPGSGAYAFSKSFYLLIGINFRFGVENDAQVEMHAHAERPGSPTPRQ